jgi:endo-1,4-beta-xylanase
MPTNALSLKDDFKNDFLIGAAINRSQFEGADQRGVPIIQAQFNSITPENILKWESVHPLPGQYDFTGPDRYVQFGESNHMYIIGHTLVWHYQTPRWVFEDGQGRPASRELLLARMREHIFTVVGRYKGRIQGWDVVNEALNDDGTLRNSPWRKIIGDDYIEKAFQFAHEADPQAQLHYNDYSLENERKRTGAIALIKKLQSEGITINCVGLQNHVKLDWPTPKQLDKTISAFAQLGVKVMITELDVDVLPKTQHNHTADVAQNARAEADANVYAQGLPEARQLELARRYGELFHVYVKHRADISRVTFWGVTDGDSWLNAFHGANYPLLFDRAGRPKPAFQAVLREAD